MVAELCEEKNAPNRKLPEVMVYSLSNGGSETDAYSLTVDVNPHKYPYI